MLHCRSRNPGRPIRKIRHIPITAAGICQLPVVRTAGTKMYSWNPTETALWSSAGYGLLQPLFSISENRKPITITLITQYNETTTVWFSHEGFRFKFSGDINTHYYHHTYLSLSPGRSVSGGSRWSVHFMRIEVIFESVLYCIYLLPL